MSQNSIAGIGLMPPKSKISQSQAATVTTPPATRKRLGPSSESKKAPKLPAQFFQAKLWKTLLTVTADHAAIIFLALVGVFCWQHLPLTWAALGNALVFQRIAYHLRGLECLVHEGSHWNWTRRKMLNDCLTNLFAAFPVFSRVEDFRGPHGLHHMLEKYGSLEDADAVRNAELDAANIDRSSFGAYAGHLLRHIGRYVWGWWSAIGSRLSAMLAGVVWHLIFVLLPLSLLFGSGTAIKLWGIYFFVPFFIVLPPMRFVAEVAKHTYDDSAPAPQGWVDCTISNIGWLHRWGLHPHGDGFHALHHLHACIPHHQLPSAHAWLVENDRDGYGRETLVRHRVLTDAHQLGNVRTVPD